MSGSKKYSDVTTHGFPDKRAGWSDQMSFDVSVHMDIEGSSLDGYDVGWIADSERLRYSV
jgi:hypothetical protein